MTLTWQHAGGDEPSDQNADTLAVPRGFWAIGIDYSTNLWSVDLYEIPNVAHPYSTIDALSLGNFPTEELAKAAAERAEQWLVSISKHGRA